MHFSIFVHVFCFANLPGFVFCRHKKTGPNSPAGRISSSWREFIAIKVLDKKPVSDSAAGIGINSPALAESEVSEVASCCSVHLDSS